jgi:hypothetical protein
MHQGHIIFFANVELQRNETPLANGHLEVNMAEEEIIAI